MNHSNSMTLHVIHDRAGRILAAAAVPDSAPGQHDVPMPLPFARAGQRLARISMPNMHPAELSAMLERHRVSGSAARARLVALAKTKLRKKKPGARKR
jgi:hypothetical protein